MLRSRGHDADRLDHRFSFIECTGLRTRSRGRNIQLAHPAHNTHTCAEHRDALARAHGHRLPRRPPLAAALTAAHVVPQS
eukprot:1017243-Prymnesium_polylepis.1